MIAWVVFQECNRCHFTHGWPQESNPLYQRSTTLYRVIQDQIKFIVKSGGFSVRKVSFSKTVYRNGILIRSCFQCWTVIQHSLVAHDCISECARAWMAGAITYPVLDKWHHVFSTLVCMKEITSKQHGVYVFSPSGNINMHSFLEMCVHDASIVWTVQIYCISHA